MVALVFGPWALWLAQWERPELRGRPLVSVYRGRVVHVSPAARKAGIVRGMTLTGASARADLEVVEAKGSHLAGAWESLLAELYGYTPELEPLSEGRVLLELEPLEARQLAQSYFARGGIAEGAEHALLGAFTAREGQVREVSLPAKIPLYVLKGFGLSPESVTRLGWLGVTHLGGLTRWKKPQLRAYLGAEAACLEPLLYGPHKRQLARYRPPVTLSARHTFEETAVEPGEVQPVLEYLADLLASRLDAKLASRLTVQVEAQGLMAHATRRAKEPLRDAPTITRLAELTLGDTKAQALGLTALTVELSGLYRPNKQGALWKTRTGLEEAITVLKERYPLALVRVEETNPYALAPEHQTRFVYLATGEEVVRETLAEAHSGELEPTGRPADADVQEPLAAG